MLRKYIYTLLILCFSSSAFISCSNDGYDTGDGNLSYLCAEFVEAFTSSDTIVVKAVTDDGASLTFTQRIKTSWTSVPDSSYRALLYYSKGDNPVRALSLRQVPVLTPKEHADSIATDPLTVESAWTSKNEKYVNLSLLLKTGVSEGVDEKQWLSLVVDPEASGTDNSLLLLHAQNGVPEYYTTRIYVSIPIAALPTGKATILRVNTYKGMKTYTLR